MLTHPCDATPVGTRVASKALLCGETDGLLSALLPLRVQLAKTPEIRELLDQHSSQSAFGLLSLTSISFSSTNASSHPPQHSAPAQDLQLPTPSAEAS